MKERWNEKRGGGKKGELQTFEEWGERAHLLQQLMDLRRAGMTD